VGHREGWRLRGGGGLVLQGERGGGRGSGRGRGGSEGNGIRARLVLEGHTSQGEKEGGGVW